MLPSISSMQSQTLDHNKNKEIKTLDIMEITKKIEKIEQNIDKKHFYKDNLSALDQEIMPFLVDMANKNKRGLNLSYTQTPEEFLDSIKKGNNNIHIIKTSTNSSHCAAIDVKKINGETSIVLFEPANLNYNSPGVLAFKIKLLLEKVNLSNRFCVVELDIQKSYYDCAIFSFAIAKKIYKHEEEICALHKFILDKEINDPNFKGYIRKKIVDQLLPVDFYKHTQSKHRIQEYLKENPESNSKILNKNNETIIDIMKSRFVESHENKKIMSISKSIHLKRLSELKKLRDLVQNERPHSIDSNNEVMPPGNNG